MHIKPLIAAALMPCALLAAPAFAQSSATKAEDYAKDKAAKEMSEKAPDMVKDEAKDMARSVLDKATHDKAKMDKPMTAPDTSLMIKGDPVMIEANETPVQPDMMDAPANVTTVVTACPEGTTAQDDGTCMITGDYEE